MVLDSMAFIRSSVYRVPALNMRWRERNTSAQQHRHDAHFDRKVGTCPSSGFCSNLPKSIGPIRYPVEPFCMLTVVSVSKLATVLLPPASIDQLTAQTGS